MDLWQKLNLFSCVFMTGLIWLVQLVQYPGFLLVAKDDFNKFHTHHSNKISFIVAPIMLIELISSYALWYFSHDNNKLNLFYFAATVTIFIITAVISVPQHSKLELLKDEIAIKSLILGNWLRTIIWSVKTSLLFISL